MIKLSPNLIILLLIVFLNPLLQAQNKYWIYFSDKDTEVNYNPVSEKTRQNRILQGAEEIQYSDFPVKAHYVNQLESAGIEIAFHSKWLNAVSAYIPDNKLAAVQQFAFVKDIDPVNQHIKVMSLDNGDRSPLYASVLEQINAKAIYEEGLDGSGVKIGIIDVGFFGAKINASLKSIFLNNQVMGFKDYLEPGNEAPFSNIQSFSNAHGTSVWKKVAGFNKSANMQYGLATGSDYFLARTDNTKYEFRGEEDYWVAAIEWLDSLGVQLVNTSLGYSLGFDDPNENYRPDQMDGKSTIISRAAQIAADEKGMLLVVAAGNEGHDPNWRVVSAPADSKGVLSVGATIANSCAKIRYSALGPEFLDYLKPNIACFSSNGTSFSAPVITGLAACIWQKNDSLTNFEVMEIIQQAGNLYPFGNNFVGYGVPDCARAMQLVDDMNFEFNRTETMLAKNNVINLEIDSTMEERIVIFHKKSEWIVLNQEEVIHQENILTIDRPENCTFTTIALQDKVIEIIWPLENLGSSQY